MTDRSSHWILTINNPTPDDEEAMNLARQRGWKIDGQLEKGENGTEHYQLHLATPQVRFSAVKKQFPRAHIEPARNAAAVAAYCKKEDTRVGSLPSTQEMYPSQKRFFELIWEVILATPEDYNFRFGSKRFVHNGELDNKSQPHRLAYWKAAKELVRRGYVVESMAVNPMTLASWDAFHLAILDRKLAGETSGQTDARSDSVEIPLVSEHNPDATDSSSSSDA